MRTERYREILPVDRLASTACTIIGVGAIGHQVAIQLAAMGIGTVQLIDHDVVDEVNLGPQAYRVSDVGHSKVEATADLMRSLNPDITIEAVPERFARSMATRKVVFACVDSIDVRRHIWSVIQFRDAIFIDGRMAAEVMRIITVCNSTSRLQYRATLFSENEALRQACTARSTLYCANIAAGLMVSQFAQWLRGFTPEFDVMLNLLSLDLVVHASAPSFTSGISTPTSIHCPTVG